MPEAHWLPSQQPAAQEVAVQVQAPLTQACPLAQSRHAVPPLPQALPLVAVTHLPPASQQPVQLAALHVVESGWQLPLVHDSPVLQVLHAPPPVPQPDSDEPGTQLPLLSQQPLQLPGPQASGAHR